MPDKILKGIGKVNEYTDPELLRDGEVTSFENMVSDEQAAKGIKRDGLQKRNTNEIGGDNITSLHEFINNNNQQWVVASSGNQIFKSANGFTAWTELGTETGTEKSIVVDREIVTKEFNDRLFITDRFLNFFESNVATENFDITFEIDTTGVETFLTTSAVGNLEADSRYRYIVIPRLNDGALGKPSYPFSHWRDSDDSYFSTGSTEKQILLTNIPRPTDSRLQDVLLYRTQGNGNVYYFHSTLSTFNSTTNIYDDILDDLADTDLDLSRSIKFVPDIDATKYIEVHKSRLFLANNRARVNNTAPLPNTKTGTPGAGFTASKEYLITLDNAFDVLEPNSEYKYKFVTIDQNGLESKSLDFTINTTASPVTARITRYNITDFFGNGPLSAAQESYDTRIYRTQADGSEYYLVESYSFAGISPQFVIDQTPDNELVTPYTSDQFKDEPNTIRYSEINKPNDINLSNVFEINPDDNDIITGIVDDSDGLLIFKQHAIYKLFTNTGSPFSWVIQKIVNDVGSDNQNSIFKAKGQVYFMSGDYLYSFPNRLSDPINLPLIKTFEAENINQISYWAFKNWLMCLTDNFILVYDEKLDIWYKWFKIEIANSRAVDDNTFWATDDNGDFAIPSVITIGDKAVDDVGDFAVDDNNNFATN